ncbi:MAG: penicillin-binding protein activator LpoB, partial [Treponema sp.]|nr:penicillin-binding protein activator LpoB [Treponema sp.]
MKRIGAWLMGRILPLVLVALWAGACVSGSVRRVDADTVTDLSGYWNDTDVRIICDSLIKSCL